MNLPRMQDSSQHSSLGHRDIQTGPWWVVIFRLPLDLFGMDESAKNARLQPAWLTGSQGHTNWTSMSDDSSSSVYPQTCLRWMNLPRMQDSSRHSSETQTSPLWLVIQLVGIIRIYHPSIKDGKKSRKFYRVLYSNTGSIFLDNFILHYDKFRFAGMGIIVVPPPPPWAEVRINRRTVARAKFVFINRGVRQFYLSFDWIGSNAQQ